MKKVTQHWRWVAYKKIACSLNLKIDHSTLSWKWGVKHAEHYQQYHFSKNQSRTVPCCTDSNPHCILRHFLYFLYLCPSLSLFMWPIFHFHLCFHHEKTYEYRHTCSFAYFLEYVLLFLGDNVDEEHQ